MGTPLIKVYEAFLNKITDFDLSYMTDDELSYFCYSLLTSSLVNVKVINSDLKIDEENSAFYDALLNVEIEIIACTMVVEWYERQINSSMITKQFIGTKDESFFAQANHIEKLANRADALSIKAKRLRRDYMYEHTTIE